MPKRCSQHFNVLVLDSMGRTFNTHCFWPGMLPIVSAPNASSPFSRPYSRCWSDMSISTSLKSAAGNSLP